MITIKIIIFLFLAYSACMDLKTRKVQNYVPICMVFCSIPFTQGLSIIPILAMSVTCYILFQLGFFGGGDAKMLIALSIVTSTLSAFGVHGAFAFAVFGISIGITAIIGIIGTILNKKVLKEHIPVMVSILVGYVILFISEVTMFIHE